MELLDFLLQTQAEIRSEVGNRMSDQDNPYPYEGLVFTEVVMQHMADNGMCSDPQICHFERKIGTANLRLSGFAVSEEADQLDLFVSLYSGADEVKAISDEETKKAAEQCLRFLRECINGILEEKIDKSEDVYDLVLIIKGSYASLDQIRIYVLTDRVAKSKRFKDQTVKGKTVKLEVMDIERLFRHWSEGKPRDELIVNFEEVTGGALPCVYVPSSDNSYDYALTAIPGEALRFLYEKYGPRLLEANVRSFLSATGKVNKGIRDTLIESPEKFLAYNNGIVLVADEVKFSQNAPSNGSDGILWLKGMQIVNGGQTTASIYFTKKKNPEVDLSRVRVPAKIIILHSTDPIIEEALISDISRYANTQNKVNLSDLSANKPFHIELEKLSTSVYCPDGVGRWFYERAAGSYNTFFTREGTTPAKLRKLKDAIPPSRKITKTDLAKFLNSWDCKPHLVSFGSQKNFERFMENLVNQESANTFKLPDVAGYKRMIAKAILFKQIQVLVRKRFTAFQANIVTYVVAVLSDRISHRIDLERIWTNQRISGAFEDLVRQLATEVNEVLHRTAGGRMVSEWAKKAECWEAVRKASYSVSFNNIPELR